MAAEMLKGKRQVPYVAFPKQFEQEKEELRTCFESVFSRGEFIQGEAVAKLEAELAQFCHVRHAVALNSGTDALILGMRALGIGPGDEVITPPNSFVASTAAVIAVGARPVFADVLEDQTIDPQGVAAAITPRTKALMPVHLTGRIADMMALLELARQRQLFIVEDAAQSMGSRLGNRPSGSFGDVGCFSAHPLKNLNAAGDAGFITTNDDHLAEQVRLFRNHGLADRNTVVVWGTVSRMDTLQAAILSMRLKHLDHVIRNRRQNAALYRKLLNPARVFIPPCQEDQFNTFHTFVVQVDQRDELLKALEKSDIGAAIHYPVPIHLQPAAQSLGYTLGDFPKTEAQAQRILSLPIHQYVAPEDIEYIAEVINRFYD